MLDQEALSLLDAIRLCTLSVAAWVVLSVADIELAVEVNGSMGSPDGDSDDAGCLVDVDS